MDAICINQDDDSERTRQVQQIRLIYERAQHVVIWLGDGGQMSSRVKALVEGLSRHSKLIETHEPRKQRIYALQVTSSMWHRTGNYGVPWS